MQIRSKSALRAARVATMMILAAMVGCGDDATEGEGDNSGGANGAENGNNGAENGNNGAEADAGKEEEDAGGKEVVCGGKVCAATALAAACCTVEGAGVAGDPNELTGRASDLCGADLSDFVPGDAYVCIQLDQPGELDAACPIVASPGGDLMGCCTDEGFCGGMETGVGLGCTYGEGGRGTACGS